MTTLFALAKPALHALDPETAHRLSIAAMKAGVSPVIAPVDDPRLKATLWGRSFPNPVGLAAGFDKNAEVIAPMLNIGFGFVEVGTVTPRPQAGNPRPRVFRCAAHGAVINRMGFPNEGVEAFKDNLIRFLERRPRPAGIVGLNIGMNKDQTEPEKDYTALIRTLGQFADYFTINISSPNTPGLRNLQDPEHLRPLIAAVQDERARSCGAGNPPPLLVKLAPDLEEAQLSNIAAALLDLKIDGVILTNTTLARPEFLPQSFRGEKGGLSGAPLKDKSTDVIRRFYSLTGGTVPIIGAGGIASGQDAYDKIRAGASLVQLYSALVYHGPELVTRICRDLLLLMEKDGFSHYKEAVGSKK